VQFIKLRISTDEMSYMQTVAFQAEDYKDGNALDFLSTKDIQIPVNSSIALRSIRFKPGNTIPLTGKLSLNITSTAGTQLIGEFDLPETVVDASQFSALSRLFTLDLRQSIGTEVRKTPDLLALLMGATISFSIDSDGILNLKSTPQIFRGVGEVLNTAGQTDLVAVNATTVINPTANLAYADALKIDSLATGPGYVFGQNPMAPFSILRFLPTDIGNDKGSIAIALYDRPFTAPVAGAVPIASFTHFMRAGTSNLPPDVVATKPYYQASLTNQPPISFVTADETGYEIRLLYDKIQFWRIVNPNSPTPKDSSGQDVQNWVTALVVEYAIDPDRPLYPVWTLTGTSSQVAPSDKRTFDCMYTSTATFDLANRIPYVPTLADFIEQSLTPVAANTVLSLAADNETTNLTLGLGNAGASIVGPGEIAPGFGFTIQGTNILSSGKFDRFLLTIEEPFNLRSTILYPPSEGIPTRPISILSAFYGAADVAATNEVDYIAETPLFFDIDTTGDISVRSFRFRLTGPDPTEKVELNGPLTMQLLIRSPRPVYTR